MKADFKKRLDEIETATEDWAANLDVLDFDWVLDDYSKDCWEELHHDQTVTVFQHVLTGEIRGAYLDRRTIAELKEIGADLAYL